MLGNYVCLRTRIFIFLEKSHLFESQKTVPNKKTAAGLSPISGLLLLECHFLFYLDRFLVSNGLIPFRHVQREIL